jgi:arylsulfatase A
MIYPPAMKRFLFSCLLVVSYPSTFITSVGADDQRLNVVFMMADDLGWGETGCYGQQKIPTPNIDRLAQEGMRFTQHYSGAPVCAPARCVLMTGKHLGHSEVRGNQQAKVHFPEFSEGQHPLSQQAVTIAQLFKKTGYTTAAIGKWGLGPVGSSGDPNRKGFDLFFGYNCQAVAHSYYPPHLWRNTEKIMINAQPIPGHARQPEGEVRLEDWIGEKYAPNLMIAEAEKFIADNAAKPFFLYLPFIEPHVAIHPPEESVAQFPTEWDPVVYRGGNGYLPHPRPRAGYAAMIHNLDSYVGRVVTALDQAGIADRTLIIFTSDNGSTHRGRGDEPFDVGGVDTQFFNSTADLRGFKGSLYEGGIRVPLIVRLPSRVPSGSINDTPSYFADWFPTLCDAVGLEQPQGLDGQSLWPLLVGDQDSLHPRNPMIWVFPEYQGQVAVRIGDFKLVRQRLHTSCPGSWEVYDLSNDRGETLDLAAQEKDLIEQAEELLRRQVSPNPVFPVEIPGISFAGQ